MFSFLVEIHLLHQESVDADDASSSRLLAGRGLLLVTHFELDPISRDN